MNFSANYKLRTKFYYTWGRLVFSTVQIDYFEDYMAVFDEAFQKLSLMIQQFNATPDFRSSPGYGQLRSCIIGIARDMRGICSASHSKSSYQVFFDWIIVDRLAIILSAFKLAAEDPDVSIPVLRFFCELTHNRSQRIEFPPSSPNGIILFKELSQALQIYCESSIRKLSSGLVQDPYQHHLKPLGIALEMLVNGLSGNYVNFGVFVLYKDDTLNIAFESILRLVLGITFVEIRVCFILFEILL
jgi:exportin-7